MSILGMIRLSVEHRYDFMFALGPELEPGLPSCAEGQLANCYTKGVHTSGLFGIFWNNKYHFHLPNTISSICSRGNSKDHIDPQHDILLKNMSPNAIQRSRPTTKERPNSSNTNYEWKHVMTTERVQNGPEQMISMCRVTDQATRREFSLNLNSLPPGTRLIRI